MDCIFCKIIEGKIPAPHLAESEDAIIIKDIQPQAPTHLLVLPKKHVTSLNDLDSQGRHKILPALFELADRYATEAGFKSQGYRAVINNQALAGQTVFHIHLHILTGATLKSGFGV